MRDRHSLMGSGGGGDNWKLLGKPFGTGLSYSEGAVKLQFKKQRYPVVSHSLSAF